MLLQSLHTHSLYDDGQDTLARMAQSAEAAGRGSARDAQPATSPSAMPKPSTSPAAAASMPSGG